MVTDYAFIEKWISVKCKLYPAWRWQHSITDGMPNTWSKAVNVYPASLWLCCLFQCSKRGMLGEGSSVYSVSWVLWCSERGARGELICSLWEGCLYSLLFVLTLQNTSCDMNIIMWLFSHLACKEIYHIIIFICTACGNKLGKCIIVSYSGSPHTLSLQ